MDGSTSVTDLGGAARRVPPVLRYFAALNTPGFAGAPDPQAVNAMIGQIDSLGGDLELLFGAHGLVELDFFREIALQMRAQMKERKKIGAAIGHETALVPERADVLTYFTSLAKKNNDEVIAAYTSYAETFFQHRIVERPEDLEVHGLEEIFARPLSVAGMRPLVCTGYAMLGSNLLNATGGATSTFIIAVRASDDQIRNGALDDGHAVAVVSRKGQTLYVSNHLVVKNKDDAIGPDAVAWTHKNFPLITATGSTVQDAIRALGREIDKRARKLTTP